MNYTINKGVGKHVEFHGLRAQYLFIFAGCLAGVFLLFVVMYLAGATPMPCIVIAAALGAAATWGTYRLNDKYGAHGLMKAAAARSRPRRIIHRKRLERLLRRSRSEIVKSLIHEKFV